MSLKTETNRPLRLPRWGLLLVVLLAAAAAVLLLGPRLWRGAFPDEHAAYLELLKTEEAGHAALAEIKARWRPHDAIMLVETLTFVEHRTIKVAAYAWLAETTGQSFGMNHHRWYEWIWNNVPGLPPRYASFKAALYGRRDPELGEYFRDDLPATIRLDEIQWGGVSRDGIPPLREPRTVLAADAAYLAPDDPVFGIEVNGETRAYPRRIMIQHELVTDVVGGEPIVGPYCTLCNAMAVYRSTTAGRRHDLGTSGFLYRSNKLMYDRATKSLWYTLSGEPVVGPLAGQSLALEPLPVVTTTWAEWRRLHPRTRVLAEDPRPLPAYGEPRDYREDFADRPYFQHDELIFTTPKRDARLKNKDEVFIVRAAEGEPVAVAVAFLTAHPVHHLEAQGLATVILTDGSGANRAYETGGRTFTALPGGAEVRDDKGETWQMREDGLHGRGRTLKRLPAHRAFWFGWHAAYPETRLIQ